MLVITCFHKKNPGKRKTITNIKVSKKTSRDALRDGCIKEFIKQKRSSGLFWAVRAKEKKNLSTAISKLLFEVVFPTFCGQKKFSKFF